MLTVESIIIAGVLIMTESPPTKDKEAIGTGCRDWKLIS